MKKILGVLLVSLFAMSTTQAAIIQIEFTQPTGTIITNPTSWVVASIRVTNTSNSRIIFTAADFDYPNGWTYGDFYDQYSMYGGGSIAPNVPYLDPGESYDSEWTRFAPRYGSAPNGLYTVTSAGIAQGYTIEDGFINPVEVVNTFQWQVDAPSISVQTVPEPSSVFLMFAAGLAMVMVSTKQNSKPA
jgi:hypothetical protein